MWRSCQICIEGTMRMSTKKFTGIIIAAYIPNPRIGLISENAFARKATAVVLEVTAMALKERLKAKAILRCSSWHIKGMNYDWRQASQNTNMSSAAIPKTMKMTN